MTMPDIYGELSEKLTFAANSYILGLYAWPAAGATDASAISTTFIPIATIAKNFDLYFTIAYIYVIDINIIINNNRKTNWI